MNNQEANIRIKIITAAVECIEKQGLQSLTIRSIAKQAGVNSAAINYYFGTKDKLLEEVLKQTLKEMSYMPEEYLAAEDLPLQDRLPTFLNAVMDGVIHFPGITKAHIYAPLMQDDYSSLFVKKFNAFLKDMETFLEKLAAKPKGKDPQSTMIQIVSALILPALMPKLFASYAQVDFENPAARKAYTDSLIDVFFEKK